LLNQQLQTVLPEDPAKAVKQTITYMHDHYQEAITVTKLAALAHIPKLQYSTIFHTITGKKPLDYLLELRITHAKHMLQTTTDPLRIIALRSGFNDEYYFNRRFRQVVGMPPKQFARLHKQKVFVTDWTGHEVEIPSLPDRVIYHGEAFGDLLIFDIKPIGGIKASIEQSPYKHHVPYVEDVSLPIDVKKLAILRPDLIIFTNADEQKYKEISSIAPTVTLNSWGTLEDRIRILGEWLGKQEQASAWLTLFYEKENKMWDQLQPKLRRGETASVFLFDHGNRLFSMGCTGFPTSLYHPNGFCPVKRIHQAIQAGRGYEEVAMNELPTYAGDRIFILISDKQAEKLALERLIATDLWRELPAVKNGLVYFIDERKWNRSDAFTREQLLSELQRLLGS